MKQCAPAMVRTRMFHYTRPSVTPSLYRTGMTTDVETLPGDLMESGGVAAFVTTLPALSNTASIAELVVNCRNDTTM